MATVLISQLSLIQPFEEGTTIAIESKTPLIGCTAVSCVIFEHGIDCVVHPNFNFRDIKK